MRKKEEEKRKIRQKERIQETLKRENHGYKEKGITLVALVITIIILIILATVTINFTFGEGGIIEQAELAKEMSESSTNTEALLMSNLTAYLEEEFQEPGEDEPVTPPGPTIPETVEEAKPAQDEEVYKFAETTQIEDASGDTMWIPGGFGIAVDSATDIDDGVVITDGTNEFVWIPVSDADLAEMYNTTTPESAGDTTLSKSSLGEATTTTKIYSKLRVRSGDSSSYTAGAPGSTNAREPDILADTNIGDASTIDARGIKLLKSELGYSGTEAQVLKSFAQNMVNEYLTVFKSIKEYDGFYIGRYELTGTAEKPTVQRHQPVLTAATSSANTWYGLKDASNRVVTGESKHAQSYMIYGNQWDEVMDWLVDTEAKKSDEINVNSSSWGNYSGSSGAAAVEGAGRPQESGFSDAWSANNIYDLAGNYFDWTQEANEADYRVGRGGDYRYAGKYDAPASVRVNNTPDDTRSYYSCRPALYIKSSTET